MGAYVIQHTYHFRNTGQSRSVFPHAEMCERVSIPKGVCNVVQTGNRDANNTITIRINMKDSSWADVLTTAGECCDGLYMDMSHAEFNAEKYRAKDDRRFSSWNEWLHWVQRIENKRQNYINNKRPIQRTSLLDDLLSTRRDYIDEPHVHFDYYEQQYAALYKIEERIRKIPDGIRRIDIDIARERTQAMPALRSFIDRIKRQAGALKTCQRIIAAKKIYNTFSRIIRMDTAISRCKALIAGVKINKFVYKRLAFWKGALHGQWRRAQQQLIWNGTRKHEIHIGNPRNEWRHKLWMAVEFPNSYYESRNKRDVRDLLQQKQSAIVDNHKGKQPHKLAGLEHLGRRARRRRVAHLVSYDLEQLGGMYEAVHVTGTEEGSNTGHMKGVCGR